MALPLLLARCSAFTEETSTDGGQSAPDGTPEATSSEAATVDAGATRFCATLADSGSPPAVCADFDEPNPLLGWRLGKLETVWAVERDPSALEIATSDRSPPSALQGTARRADGGIAEGLYATTLATAQGFRVAVDVRYSTLGDTTSPSLPIILTLGARRINFRLSPTGGSIEITRPSNSAVTRPVPPGMPSLRDNWLGFVVEVSKEPSPDGGSGTRLRATLGGFQLLDETAPATGADADLFATLPTSLKLQIGVNDSPEGRVVQFENVVIETR